LFGILVYPLDPRNARLVWIAESRSTALPGRPEWRCQHWGGGWTDGHRSRGDGSAAFWLGL